MKVVVQYFWGLFLKLTDKEEIANIISSLNSHEVSGPKRIPYRILFLLKKWNFEAIGRFTLPLFYDWCFPSVLKTTKVVPVFKQDSKLDFSGYHPMFLLSNIEKNSQ